MNTIDGSLWRNITRKTLLIMLIFGVIFGFCGCAGPRLPQSTANLYPDRPHESSIPGSLAQVIVSRTMPATFDELFDATYKTAFHQGFDVDYKDMKKGKLSGKGVYEQIAPNYGPTRIAIVFAAYIEEIDQKPTTKLTIVADFIAPSLQAGKKGWAEAFANDFIRKVQKLLATLQ